MLSKVLEQACSVAKASGAMAPWRVGLQDASNSAPPALTTRPPLLQNASNGAIPALATQPPLLKHARKTLYAVCEVLCAEWKQECSRWMDCGSSPFGRKVPSPKDSAPVTHGSRTLKAHHDIHMLGAHRRCTIRRVAAAQEEHKEARGCETGGFAA